MRASFDKVLLGIEVMYELVRARVWTKNAVQAALDRSSTFNPQVQIKAEQREFVSRLARLIWILGDRSSVGFTCLHRSVAALRVLEKRDVESRLMVAPSEDGDAQLFTAHAWVEVVGDQMIGRRVKNRPVFSSTGTDTV